MSSLAIVNLEEGFPSRDEAVRRLGAAIARARQKQIRVLKVIHGYGSSGVGGILRPVVRNFLRQAKEKGEISLFLNGERVIPRLPRPRSLSSSNCAACPTNSLLLLSKLEKR